MKNLKLYIAITYGLIWAVGLVIFLTGIEYPSIVGNLMASACMFFPLVATLICQASSKEPLFRNIGIHWKVNRWWFIGWGLMLLITLLTLLVNWCIAGDRFTLDTPNIQALCNQSGMSPLLSVVVTLLAGMVTGATFNALFAFGEEAGWRGYLLRQFAGMPFLSSAIFIGLIWGLWHAPLILLGHNYPQHPQLGVLFMMAMCVPLATIIQYIRIKSGSVIVAAIMHGTFNAVAGTTLLFLNDYNDLLDGTAGLVGMAVLFLVAFALFLYDRYGSKERLFTRPLDLEALK